MTRESYETSNLTGTTTNPATVQTANGRLRRILLQVCFLGTILAFNLKADICQLNIPVTPDATMTPGPTPSGLPFDQRTSVGTSYTEDCNGTPYYTVDIVLPSTYTNPSGGNMITISAGFPFVDHGGYPSIKQVTYAECPYASEAVKIERSFSDPLTKAQTSPTVVFHQYAQGHWVPIPIPKNSPYVPPIQGFCALSVPYDASPVPGVITHYRVGVIPYISGKPAQASVKWESAN